MAIVLLTIVGAAMVLLAIYSSDLPLFGEKVDTTAARKEDIAYIMCNVCAAQLHHHRVYNKQASNFPAKVMEYSDTDFVAEYTHSSKSQFDQLLHCLCKDLSGVCPKKKPQSPVLEVRNNCLCIMGIYIFSFLNHVCVASKQAKMDKIFRCVKGLSESAEHEDMYSEEEFMDNIDPGDENVAGQTSFSMNNMGKVVREKWKQMVTKGKTSKKHALRAMITVKKWWKEMEAEMDEMEETMNNADGE
ncbi:hypothetical protein LINPERPRIM_LOCUS38940 [Linum perenne]